MQMQDEMSDLYNRKIRYQGRLEHAGQKEQSKLSEKIEWVEQRAKKLHAEMNQKTTTQSEGSGVAETFRLPDSFGQDGWGAGDGYAVWEPTVRRRIQTAPKTRRVATSRLRSSDRECNRGDDPHKHGCAPTGQTHCTW